MLNATNHRRCLIRKVIAVAVLCLLVLRGMGFIGMAAALAASHADSPFFAHVILGDQCSQPDGSDAPRKSTHSEHCVLCCSQVRDLIAPSTPILAEVILCEPHQGIATETRFEKIPHFVKAPGLIANWSATSPPRGRTT
jgi:hypothetical protein